jgi:hypothetical protein
MTHVTEFKAINYVYEDSLNSNCLYSVIDWLNWASLGIGAFQNVDVNLSGTYGGDRSRLRPVTDSRYTSVYEGFRQNWVWETGSFLFTPQYPTGVWIDGTYYESGHSTYGFTVNYPLGRLIFNTEIPSGTVVQTTFSPRTVTFTPANTPQVRFLMHDSYNVERNDFLQTGSGNWGQWGDVRLQLPIVAVDILGNTFRPYQLGNTSQWCNQNVAFYVFGENQYDVDQYVDILRLQNDTTLMLLDRAAMKNDVNYPFGLKYDGDVVDSPVMYPTITASGDLQWRITKLTNMRKQDMQALNNWLYRGVVVGELEMIMVM